MLHFSYFDSRVKTEETALNSARFPNNVHQLGNLKTSRDAELLFGQFYFLFRLQKMKKLKSEVLK
jgi:hypothetical protein